MRGLEDIQKIEDPVSRRATFAALLSREVLQRGGEPPVLVGGEAVEIYTQGSYTTGDIDMVAPKDITEAVLREWGFEKTGRVWLNRELDIYVDWQGGSLKGCAEPETIALGGGLDVRVISIEDLVLDRLNAVKFWGDADSLMWAKVLLRVKQEIGEVNEGYLRERAAEEGTEDFLEKALAVFEDKDG